MSRASRRRRYRSRRSFERAIAHVRRVIAAGPVIVHDHVTLDVRVRGPFVLVAGREVPKEALFAGFVRHEVRIQQSAFDFPVHTRWEEIPDWRRP